MPMKKIIVLTFTAIILFGWSSWVKAGVISYSAVSAPGVSGDKTGEEEAKGRVIWEKLKTKQATCANLSDEEFDVIGEYFMGQMLGSSHAAMNAMMVQMMGEQGETQMHIVMGKRLSGCDVSVAYPVAGVGFMPMMQMMSGFGLAPQQNWSFNGKFNFINTMMNFGLIALFFLVIWWVIVIAVIVVFVRWIAQKLKGGRNGKSSVDILKERYARGEIDKKEFHEKKKDIES